MRRLHYLAYGSNLHPLRLAERVPSCSLLASLRILGHRLAFHKRGQDGSGKCNLLPDPDPAGFVIAALYSMDAEEKPLLDRVEGLDRGYHQDSLQVGCAGRKYSCFLYRAQPSHIEPSLQPYPWYKELVALGAEYLGAPGSYIARIRRMRCVEDRNAATRSGNEVRVRRLQRANLERKRFPNSEPEPCLVLGSGAKIRFPN